MRRWWWLPALAAAAGAFNLEPRLAVVKRGRPGSYFGYSVAQHQMFGDRDDGHHICKFENFSQEQLKIYLHGSASTFYDVTAAFFQNFVDEVISISTPC